MNDLKELLDREARLVDEAPDALESVLRRRDRKRRNQRITAGVVGIAVFVAAIWIVTSGASTDHTPTPANETVATDVAEDVVRGFLAALGAFDPEAAMTYVADDADLSELFPSLAPANERSLSRMLALFEAEGYQQTITSCQVVPFGSGWSVLCGFDFNMIGSDQLGRGPFTGRFVFTVRDGEIVKAGWWPTPQMLGPFAEWLSATHPRDFEVMFTELPPSFVPPPNFKGLVRVRPSVTDESIRLWRLRTREYVESVQQRTA
jgi:hypothetical protein